MSTRTRLLVTALAAWSLFVWVNRITNAWTGDEGLFSKLVSTVLAAALIVVAVAAVSEVWRRDARRAALLSKALAGGPIAFLVVHMVLAAASIALAVVVWRAVSADTEALDAGPGRPELPL